MSDNQDQKMMGLAYQQAYKSYLEGGVPVGAIMVKDGGVISAGHNRRVQDEDPTAHGEIDCLRRAGRKSSYNGVTLYTTLSPCMMCSGAILQFGVTRVVIGENRNFRGNIEFLQSHGVQVDLLEDKKCMELMDNFIKEKPDLWNEDIAGRTDV